MNNNICHKIVTSSDFIKLSYKEQTTENDSALYILLVLSCTMKSSGVIGEILVKSVYLTIEIGVMLVVLIAC